MMPTLHAPGGGVSVGERAVILMLLETQGAGLAYAAQVQVSQCTRTLRHATEQRH